MNRQPCCRRAEGAYSATGAFERRLARQDELLRRTIEAQDARVQKALAYTRAGSSATRPRAMCGSVSTAWAASRCAFSRGSRPFLPGSANTSSSMQSGWSRTRAGSRRLSTMGARSSIFTWEDVRGRPWLIATLRNCGWKVLEGRIFNDALLFAATEPLPVAVVVAEIKKARGDPLGDADSVEPAETDPQLQAGVCERRERKESRLYAGGLPLGHLRVRGGCQRASRWRSAALTSSCVGVSRRVARGGCCSTTRPIRLCRLSLLPTPLATR